MIFSLGTVIVASAGIPVRATSNQTDSTKRFPANSVLIEALSTNSGDIYVGVAGMNAGFIWVAGLNGIVAVIPPPTASVYGSFSASDQRALVGLNLADLWIDAEVDGEGVVISGLIS